MYVDDAYIHTDALSIFLIRKNVNLATCRDYLTHRLLTTYQCDIVWVNKSTDVSVRRKNTSGKNINLDTFCSILISPLTFFLCLTMTNAHCMPVREQWVQLKHNKNLLASKGCHKPLFSNQRLSSDKHKLLI